MSETSTWKLSGFADEISDDPAIQLAVLAALGARHIEVRGAWGTNVADFESERTEALAQAISQAGFGVSAVASPIGKVDVALPIDHEVTRLGRVIDVAHRLGTRYVRIFSFYRSNDLAPEDIRDDVLDRMHALTDLAEAADVVLLHENEKDIYGDVPARVLDLVEAVGSDHLRLAWDPANFVQVGVKPYTEGWGILSPYVDYLQVKDAVAATGEVTPAGEGDGELLETVTALRDAGYAGYASLEPHLATDRAVDGPEAFGRAARGLARLLDRIGVTTA